MLFSPLDLVIGAIGIRLIRRYRKMASIPDIIFVQKNLAFGGMTCYERLRKLGINTIIDLRIEVSDQVQNDHSLAYHKIGIIDGSIPSIAQVNEVLEIINYNIGKKKKIFIHCNLGRGRAALITALFLLKDGMDLESTLKIVKKRKFIYLNNTQLNFLKNFAESASFKN